MDSLALDRRKSRSSFVTVTGGNKNKLKTATRHFAALNFLSNINMKAETKIREFGHATSIRSKTLGLDGFMESDDDDYDDYEDLNLYGYGDDENNNIGTSLDDPNLKLDTAPGRKLHGKAAPTGRMPLSFRYKLMKISDQSAVIRQWEESILQSLSRFDNISTNITNSNVSTTNKGTKRKDLKSSSSARMFFSRSRGYPNAVSSIIAYVPEKEYARLVREKARNEGLQVFQLPSRDWRGHSYSNILKTTAEISYKSGEYAWYDRGYSYDPDLIDDPEMIHGAAKYVSRGDIKTGPIIASVILFTNPAELKQSLNEQFREKHQELPPSLTLSKIRKLKKTLLLICMKLDMEISTVALACVYFERLCIKGWVNKPNRRLCMAASFLLAYKYNEASISGQDEFDNNNDEENEENIEGQQRNTKLDSFIEFVDHEWNISKSQLIDAEFGCFVELDFALHVPSNHVIVMCTRLLKLIHMKLRDHLGDEMIIVLNEYLRTAEKNKREMENRN